LRQRASPESRANADQRRDLRRSNRRDRRADDAGDSLSGQADRRACEGQGDGKDSETVSPTHLERLTAPFVLGRAEPLAASSVRSPSIHLFVSNAHKLWIVPLNARRRQLDGLIKARVL